MSTEKSVRVRCRHCKKVLSFPAALCGNTITCPNPACKMPVTLPEAAAAVPQPVKAEPHASRSATETDAKHLTDGRRWLIVTGVAGGAFVLAGCVLLMCVLVGAALVGRQSRPEQALKPGAPDVFDNLPNQAPKPDGGVDPAGADGKLPVPGYLELAQLLVDEHRTESKEPFVTSVEARPGTNPLTVCQFVSTGIVSSDRVVAMPPVLPIVQPDKLLPVVNRLAGTQNPAVRLALDKFEEARQRGDKVDKQIDAYAAEEKKRIAEITERARRGDFVETIPAETELVSNGMGGFVQRVVREARTVDRGPAMIEGAKKAARIAEECAPEDKKNWRHLFLEEARVEAWKTMAPRLVESYPHNPATAEMVQIRITPFDPKTKRGPEFTAVNTGNQVLTNVTLIMQVHHFMTAPEETNYRVYFIPRWQVGQSIYLSLTLWRSDAERQGREERARTSRVGRPPDGISDAERWRIQVSKLRPVGAYPAYNSENTWLNDLGGVVRVVSAAWALEANQPEKITSFPAHAEAAAKWEMNSAIRSLASKSLVPGKFTVPADAPEVQAARRVLTYAAADSPPARQAKLLIENPEAFANERKKEHIQKQQAEAELFAKLTEPGTSLVGDWKLDFPAAMVANNPGNFPKGFLDHKDNHGKVALRFETRDMKAKTITATLYDPDRPEQQRALKGKIQMLYGNRTGIHFFGHGEEFKYMTPKEKLKLTPQEREALKPPPEKWELLTTPASLQMWIDGDSIRLVPQTNAFWGYRVTVQPSKDVPPPAKKK